MASQETGFTLVNGVLHYVDAKNDDRRRVAVPQHLQKQLLEENHSGLYGGHLSCPPLHPIPIQRPFQIIDDDMMDLPCTESGNKHVVVFQDTRMFMKWPMIYAVPDQTTEWITRLLCP